MPWVALVGPELEENLSLRYLASSLAAAGFRSEIVPFDEEGQLRGVLEELLSRSEPPLLVGLSLSFQRRARDFLALAVALRNEGYRGHITAGGHFGTFACRELLADFHEIDSICRHEAEETLVRLATELGWTAALVEGDARRTGLDAAPAPDARTAAVVMTHRYERDRALLAELLPSPAGYIGILGPRARTAQLLDDLRQEGIVPTEAQLARLFAPVGLDVGAESPEEVAVAIVGEVMAVMAGREGGQLRARKGAIHS